MANFAHYSNVNSLFKKKNEQVWKMRNQDKLASPPPVGFARPKLRRKISLKLIISIVIFGLLLVGGVSAMILSQLQQDVRQRASGCTYWNGQPATEGAHDNRGGIRQQCVNGYWTVPSDGNTDPSQIIAEQNAAKPKLGCVDWTGNSVNHGAYDNRGGIRQQCNNGLWDVPDDGNTDPSGMPKPEREMRGCINWSGQNVSHGAYDVRGDIRQQCVDGLWDAPDDHITDPNDTASLAIVGAIGGLSGGDMEYAEARSVYDQYCKGDVHPTDIERCKSFGRLLTNEEQMMRYAALEEKVRSNTDQVSFAIGGLDERTMDYAEASGVYREYCTGTKAQLTSSSVCGALKERLEAAPSPSSKIIASLKPSSIPWSFGGTGVVTPSPFASPGYSSPTPTVSPSVRPSFYPRSSGFFGTASPPIAPSPSPTNDTGPCCVGGEYQSSCSVEDYDYVPRNPDDCRLRRNSACSTNDDCGSEGKCLVTYYGRYCVESTIGSTGGCGDGTCSSEESISSCSMDCNEGNSRIRCLANNCIDGSWCTEQGYVDLGFACGNSVACEDGTTDGNCNIGGQRCVNGVLYRNQSCADEAERLREIQEAREHYARIASSILPSQCLELEEEYCGYAFTCAWTGAACAPRVAQEDRNCTCSGYGSQGNVGDTLVFQQDVFGEEVSINRTCIWLESRNSCTWTVAQDGGVVGEGQLSNNVIAVDESVVVFEPETRRNLQRAIELEEQYGVELNFVNAITDDDIAMLERSLPILEEAGFLHNDYGSSGSYLNLGLFTIETQAPDDYPLEIVLYNNTDPDAGGGGVTFRGGGVVYVGGTTTGQSENDYDWATNVVVHEAAHNNEGEHLEGYVEALAEDGFEVLPYTEDPVGSDFCYSSTDVESWACGVSEYWLHPETFCATYVNTCEYLETEVFND